jgi:hypothetical protein
MFDAVDWNRVFVIHASWTGSFKEKKEMLDKSGDYFFTHTKNCTHYNEDLDVPMQRQIATSIGGGKWLSKSDLALSKNDTTWQGLTFVKPPKLPHQG